MATSKFNSTPAPETHDPEAMHLIEPACIAPQFVDSLAIQCEELFGEWLRKHGTDEANNLWSGMVWLRHYVTISEQHNGSVTPYDNAQIGKTICDAVNAAVAMGADFIYTTP